MFIRPHSPTVGAGIPPARPNSVSTTIFANSGKVAYHLGDVGLNLLRAGILLANQRTIPPPVTAPVVRLPLLIFVLAEMYFVLLNC